MTDPTRTEQATAELRRADEPGWEQVSDRIRDVLRSTVLPATTVVADHGRGPDAGADERDLVSTRALRAVLRTALISDQACPHSISFDTEGDRLIGVEVHLTVIYGAVLSDVLAEALATVGRCLDDALGQARDDVEVHVVAADVLEQADWT